MREMDLNQRPLGYEPNELPNCSIPQYKNNMAPNVGFEPTTKWLTVTYSATELIRNVLVAGVGIEPHLISAYETDE